MVMIAPPPIAAVRFFGAGTMQSLGTGANCA